MFCPLPLAIATFFVLPEPGARSPEPGARRPAMPVTWTQYPTALASRHAGGVLAGGRFTALLDRVLYH
jgi:hypothetical protein